MVNMLASKPAADLPPRDHNKPPSVVELLASELVDTYKIEMEKIEPIAKRATGAPQKIESDDDLKIWSEIYLDTSALFKSLDTARLNEQRPLLAVFKTVLGGTLERAERIMEFGKKISNDYNRAKLARESAQREADAKKLREEAEQRRRDAEVAAEFGDVDQTVEHAQGAAAIENQIAQAAADAPSAADVARVRTDSGAMATVATTWAFEIDYSAIDLNSIRNLIDQKAINTAVGKIVKVQKGSTKIAGVRVFEEIGTSFRR